jgi:hypothetical protein
VSLACCYPSGCLISLVSSQNDGDMSTEEGHSGQGHHPRHTRDSLDALSEASGKVSVLFSCLLCLFFVFNSPVGLLSKDITCKYRKVKVKVKVKRALKIKYFDTATVPIASHAGVGCNFSVYKAPECESVLRPQCSPNLWVLCARS